MISFLKLVFSKLVRPKKQTEELAELIAAFTELNKIPAFSVYREFLIARYALLAENICACSRENTDFIRGQMAMLKQLHQMTSASGVDELHNQLSALRTMETITANRTAVTADDLY